MHASVPALTFSSPTVQLDDYSDDGGSPNVKDKRVKANRLSAQRSRQRKLEKEAQLTQDVEKLNRQVAAEQHKEHMLINEEAGELLTSLLLAECISPVARPACERVAARQTSSTVRLRPGSILLMNAHPNPEVLATCSPCYITSSWGQL